MNSDAHEEAPQEDGSVRRLLLYVLLLVLAFAPTVIAAKAMASVGPLSP